MSTNKKQQQQDKSKKSTDKTVDILHQHNENIKDNNTGAVNGGNLVNSGRTKNRTELHTKSSVLGSDSDGQAD